VTSFSALQIAMMLNADAPTLEQQAIIEAPLAPTLVVAGAGSGKTETMAARVVYLVANGLVAPEQVLGLTFTRKAAGELGERVRRRLRHLARVMPGALAEPGALDLARPTVSTYNSYAASLVADHVMRLGIEPGSRLLGEAAQWQLANDVVERWGEDLDTDAAISTVVGAVRSLDGALNEHMLSPAEARSRIHGIIDAIMATPAGAKPRLPYAKTLLLVASLEERLRVLDLVEAYRARKRAEESLDFGDQVALAERLAREVPGVGTGERARFRVVLLDEYQDTSVVQARMLGLLFGGGHPVMAVGDPQQSIYGWRGASAGGLERFRESFYREEPDGTRALADRLTLSVSWRNDRRILDVANAISQPLRAIAGHGSSDPPLRERPRAGGGEVTVHYAESEDTEATAIAEYVAGRWRPTVRTGSGPVTTPVTAAVLCRKRAQFSAIHRALRARDIPVEVVGLGGLLAAPEVTDLVAALQTAHDPSRGDALMRLLTGPRLQLGAADLHALADWSAEIVAATRHRDERRTRVDGPVGPAEGDLVEGDVVDERSIVDALDDLPRSGWTSRRGRSLTPAAHERLADLSRALRRLREHTYLSLPELVAEAERLLLLDIEVSASPGAGAGRGRANLDAFRSVAADFAGESPRPTLGAFLAWLGAAERQERGLDRPVAEPDPDAVQLITVHGAKGLEWDVVAVAGLSDGVFPAIRTGGPHGPRDSGWLTGLGTLPFPLRGDAGDLPVFAYEGADSPKDLNLRRERFLEDAGDHQLREERRLAYVAVTRARHHLLLTGSYWRDATTAHPPAVFLTELAEAGLVPADGGFDGPAGLRPEAASGADLPVWPSSDQLHGRREALERAAAAVRAQLGRATGGLETGGRETGGRETDPGTGAVEARDIRSRDVGLLLAERRRGAEPDMGVELPAHLSASALVRLSADPQGFAQALRRPIPVEPSPQARRGTQFHAWVESHFAAPALVDIDDLPGTDDDSVPTDLDQAGLRSAFLASVWAGREPVAIEVDIETPVAGYVLRSRIDAVFPDPESAGGAGPDGVVVLDWKTGRPPTTAEAARSRELQLAVYRLAWSRWTGTPLDRVRAAFFYVGSGQTVYPETLLDEGEIMAFLIGATPTVTFAEGGRGGRP
jgi:DNA helicase-2/ATP-dependent DNA helicase PcrA